MPLEKRSLTPTFLEIKKKEKETYQTTQTAPARPSLSFFDFVPIAEPKSPSKEKDIKKRPPLDEQPSKIGQFLVHGFEVLSGKNVSIPSPSVFDDACASVAERTLDVLATWYDTMQCRRCGNTGKNKLSRVTDQNSNDKDVVDVWYEHNMCDVDFFGISFEDDTENNPPVLRAITHGRTSPYLEMGLVCPKTGECLNIIPYEEIVLACAQSESDFVEIKK